MLSVWQVAIKVLLISPHIHSGRPTCKRTFTESENNTDWIRVPNVQHFGGVLWLQQFLVSLPVSVETTSTCAAERPHTSTQLTRTCRGSKTSHLNRAQPSTAILLQAEGSRRVKTTATFPERNASPLRGLFLNPLRSYRASAEVSLFYLKGISIRG